MTLEQATLRAQAAAAAGDMEALGEALKARAAAIREVRYQPLSEAKAARFKAAFEAGESIARDLRLFKMKLSIDTHRLKQIQSALLAGLGAEPRSRLDFQG